MIDSVSVREPLVKSSQVDRIRPVPNANDFLIVKNKEPARSFRSGSIKILYEQARPACARADGFEYLPRVVSDLSGG